MEVIAVSSPIVRRVDNGQVEEFLVSRERGPVTGIVPLSGGNWSQAFAFRQRERDWVIRFGEYGEDFAKDRLAHQFSSPDLPIPRVAEIGSGLGLHYCVSERVAGQFIDDADASEMVKLIPAVFRMLDALREADIQGLDGIGMLDANGEAPFTSWPDYLLSVDEETERVSGWHDALEDSPPTLEIYRNSLGYLRQNVTACPNVRHLLHTDLLHYNVFVSGNAISGVIDWGNAMIGDFLYDLAHFTFYAPWYATMNGIDWLAEARSHFEAIGLKVDDFDVRLRCCELHIGIGGLAYGASRRSWTSSETHAARLAKVLEPA